MCNLPIQHKIKIKDGTIPVVFIVRKKLLIIKKYLKSELDNLKNHNINNGPTNWVHPLVVVKKSN